jgi:hypothetical protein
LTFDWSRQLKVPFVRLSRSVSLIENCSGLLEFMSRISFETPSAIVPLQYVVRLAAKLMLSFRLTYSSIKEGLGSNIE